MLRRCFAAAALVGAGVIAACVGDDPESETGTPDAGTDATISNVDGSPTSDASSDSPAVDAGPCDLAKPFVAKGFVDGPSVSDLWLAPGELEGLGTFPPDGGGNHALFAITRSSSSAPFTIGTDLFAAVNNANLSVRGGSVSPDGLTLLFFSPSPDGIYRIYSSKRQNTSDAWGAPVVQSVPDITDPWTRHPEWIDATTVLIASDSFNPVGDSGKKRLSLHRAKWGGSAFTSSTEILELRAWEPQRASISEGETAIVFGSQLVDGKFRIYDAKRAGAEFGSPTIVAGGVQTASGEYPLYLTRNGCRMYYRSDDDPRLRLAVRE